MKLFWPEKSKLHGPREASDRSAEHDKAVDGLLRAMIEALRLIVHDK